MSRPALAAVNAAAAALGPFRFALGPGGRLALAIKGRDPVPALLRRDGLWFLGGAIAGRTGGTDHQGLAQLALWHLDRRRKGRPSWGDDPAVPHLEAGGYFDPARTACLLCGAPEPTDWLAVADEPRCPGPLCRHGLCAGPTPEP